jgi:hypothetical protein
MQFYVAAFHRDLAMLARSKMVFPSSSSLIYQ